MRQVGLTTLTPDLWQVKRPLAALFAFLLGNGCVFPHVAKGKSSHVS